MKPLFFLLMTLIITFSTSLSMTGVQAQQVITPQQQEQQERQTDLINVLSLYGMERIIQIGQLANGTQFFEVQGYTIGSEPALLKSGADNIAAHYGYRVLNYDVDNNTVVRIVAVQNNYNNNNNNNNTILLGPNATTTTITGNGTISNNNTSDHIRQENEGVSRAEDYTTDNTCPSATQNRVDEPLVIPEQPEGCVPLTLPGERQAEEDQSENDNGPDEAGDSGANENPHNADNDNEQQDSGAVSTRGGGGDDYAE